MGLGDGAFTLPCAGPGVHVPVPCDTVIAPEEVAWMVPLSFSTKWKKGGREGKCQPSGIMHV